MAAPTTETIPPDIRGFYAVLDRDDAKLAQILVSPDGAGARILQVRLKSLAGSAGTRDLLRVGAMARAITRAAGARLIINDRLDVALAVGADGVHLGQDDLPLADARRLVDRAGARGLRDRRFLIGISTHDLAQVAAAIAGGADYRGFGPIFATTTKANPDPVQGIPGLTAAVRAAAQTPIVAIGGVTPAACPDLAAAGAAAACCISAVNSAPDIAHAGRTIAAAWPDAL